MIPAEFDYHAPRSLREATELLDRLADAKVLGGGMSLIPALKHRLATPGALVDLGHVAELGAVSERRGRISIGAMASHAEVARAPATAGVPLFAETAAVIGDVQVRNRGTFGGSLVHADPAADWPAVFLALDGEARVAGARGERRLPARDFFTGMLQSAVAAGEILTEVRFEVERKRAGTAYRKLRQPASGFAIVGAAAYVVLDRRGRCEKVALALTGVNSVPFRAQALEAKLAGQVPEPAKLKQACAVIEEADPLDDLHASAAYRRHLAGVYAGRALEAACARAAA